MVSDIQRVGNFAPGWREPWTMVRTMGDSTTTRPFGLGAPMRTWGNTTTKRGAALVTASCQVSWHKIFIRSAQMYVEVILPELWSYHNQVSAKTLMSVEPVSNPIIGPVKTLATHGYATTARSCVAIVLKKEAHLVTNPMGSFWVNQSTPLGVQISAGTLTSMEAVSKSMIGPAMILPIQSTHGFVTTAPRFVAIVRKEAPLVE